MAKTEAEWMAEALVHAKAATITPGQWAERIKNGYGEHPGGLPRRYVYENTELWKALTSLYAAAHPSPVPTSPPQPPSPVNPQALRVVFCAEDPGHALNAPTNYALAFSADLEYRYPTEKRPDLNLMSIIDQARRRGHRVAGWCDCRVNGGTSAQIGVDFVRDYSLGYFIGQAESQAEMENALSVGAKVVVGNITAAGVAPLINPGVAFIQEDYWNEGWARFPEDPRIAAYCAGIYPTTLWPEPGAKVTNYRQAGRWRDGDGIYYARPDTDWANLP